MLTAAELRAIQAKNVYNQMMNDADKQFVADLNVKILQTPSSLITVDDKDLTSQRLHLITMYYELLGYTVTSAPAVPATISWVKNAR